MTHLNDVELVDALDEALTPRRAAHLGGCEACRRRVDSLRLTMSMVRPAEEEVPEPSPLFWEHFSSRVHEAVRDIESSAPSSTWLRGPFPGWVTAAAIVVVAAVTVFWSQGRKTRDPASPTAEQTSSATPHLEWNMEDDENWALVRMVAEDLHWENAQDAGLHAHPGSAERVALEMSAAERQALARLIEDDLTQVEKKRSGA